MKSVTSWILGLTLATGTALFAQAPQQTPPQEGTQTPPAKTKTKAKKHHKHAKKTKGATPSSTSTAPAPTK